MAVQREKIVRNAEKYASRGRIDAAIREYRKVLSETPDDVATLNRVGDLYARADRDDEAIKLYAQIAESYTADGFFVKAIAIYKKIIKLDPTRLEVYENLASLYHRQGLRTEARTQYQVLADYYLKHDNPSSAIAIYERMVEVDPKDPALRVKLADLYREMKLLDKALDEYRSIAETMLAAGAADEAEQVYRRALDVDASDIGFITDAVLKLRESGEVGRAAHLLAQAVELNPAASRVARLVGLDRPAPAADGAVAGPEAGEAQEVEPTGGIEEPAPAAGPEEGPPDAADQQLGPLDLDAEPVPADEESPVDREADAEPPGEAAAEAPAPAGPTPIEDPEATGSPQFGDELELDLDLDEVFVLDFDEDEAPPASQVQPPPDLADSPAPAAEAPGPEASGEGSLGVDPDVLERTAAEIQPERIRQEEDLFTEAEVLSKYGLTDKAGERLGELLAMNPTHVAGLALQVRLHLDRGAHAEAAAAAGTLRTIADERSDAWRSTAERLQSAGHEITVDGVVPPVEDPATLPGAPAESFTAAGGPAGEEVGAPADDRAAPDTTPDLASSEATDPPALVFPAPVADETAADETADDETADEPTADEPTADEPTADELRAETPPETSPETLRPAARAPRRASGDIDSLLAEIASGVGSTRRPPRSAEAEPSSPADATAPERSSPPPADDPASADRPAQPPAPPADAPPPTESAAAAAAESVNWLDEVERATGRIGPEEAEDDFFSSEEDFFDLAAELEQELSQEGELDDDQELLLAQPREQTLEEIVDGFKRGVSETLSVEDHATHYDLGIAYREMGLLDEAIGEFQIAAKDPALLVSCCSMLGLSFLEKGLPELAVKWYRRGLEVPDLEEEDQLGLLYDLGNAHLTAGDREAAYEIFVELYGINSHYRDVVARLEEARPPS